MYRFRTELFFKTFIQAAAMAFIAVVLALAFNNFRAQGLPLVADWSPEARLKTAACDSLILSAEQALEFHRTREAIFVDARSPQLYAEGHIAGAWNLPWLELVLGLCLAAGIWLPGAVLWSNALLWTFFAALVFNVIRGLDIHCGCFSTNVDTAGASPMVWYLFRDASFLLAGGYLMVYLFWIPQPSGGSAGDGEGSSIG